jgi:hypothetical protein
MPFATSLNKDTIRNLHDKKIIEIFGNSLTYFGLPGPEILDIKEWKKCLGSVIAVERDDIAAQQLLDNMFNLGFNLNNFQLLHGDIDDILIKGIDRYGTLIKFPFNLVNLDYEGGILYKDLKGKAKRIKAIEQLLERQRESGRSFLLFFTFNSRNKDKKEFNDTIDIIEEHLRNYRIGSEDTENFFEWYRNSRYDYKIKIYVLHLIFSLISTHQFECKCHCPITYKGHEDIRMIHFAFELKWSPNIAVRPYNIIEMLNTPMKEVEKGEIKDLELPILKISK